MKAEQTSFLFGANAPFIEELYARYLADPASVDGEWQTFFAALAEQKDDVLAEVRGASWAPHGARVIGAVDPDAVPTPANRNVKGGKAANGAAAPVAPAIAGKTEQEIRAGHRAGADADPRLPHPRPSRGRSRSAGSRAPGAAPRTRSGDLWLCRGRLGPSDPDLRVARAGRSGDSSADHGAPAQDLLRQDRRRVHAHLRSRPEGVDPGAHRAHREPYRVHGHRPQDDPSGSDWMAANR